MTTHKPATAHEVADLLTAMADKAQSDILMRFFKTGEGEYGEGDMFLGIRVPQTRAVGDTAAHLDEGEIEKLLLSPWHEIRLCGFLILVKRMHSLTSPRRRNSHEATCAREHIVDFYLRYARQANNWDLVDLSAPKIVGEWLVGPSMASDDHKTATLDRLADSSCLWEQRIAMVSTMTPTRNDDPRYTLRYAERLLHHSHDLMHKAVGWMLRELGKRNIGLLRAFLENHHDSMSRTTLRYAIERMDDEERRMWMGK